MVMAVGLEDVFSKERSSVSKYSVRIYLDFVSPLTMVNSIEKSELTFYCVSL